MVDDDSYTININSGSGITAGRDVNLNVYSGSVEIGCSPYPFTDIIIGNIKKLINFAEFCERKKEYDEALAYYEEIKLELEKSPSEKLLLKTIVGEAVCYHKKGNFTKAKSLIQQAEDIDPQNPVVLADIASLLKSENSEEAEKYANKALRLDQNNFLAKCVLGLLECDKGNFEEALKILRQASNVKPKDGYSFYCMSYLYSLKQDYENSIKYAKEAVKIEPNEAAYTRELGLIYLKSVSPKQVISVNSEYYKKINNDYVEEAIRCFNKVIELNEAQKNQHLNCEIYLYLGHAYLAKNEMQSSIDFYNLALECGLDEIELYIKLGQAHLGNGDYDEVIEYYEPLITKENLTEDELFVVKANLATAYFINSELDKAEKLLEEVIDENPENVNINIQLACVLEKKGDVGKAILTLNKICKIPRKPWDFYYTMGRLHHKNNEYEDAVQHFKEAISKNSKAIPLRIDLINLYIECNMHEYAIKQAKELIQLDSTGINFYNLASLYYKIENYEESAFFSRKALEANYDNVETYSLLCSSLLQANKACEAKDEFEKALKKYPNDLGLKLNYSATLSTLELSKEAIYVLNQITNDDPRCAFAYRSLAQIYYKEAFYEKALENAQKVVFIEPENEDAHFVIACSLLMLGKNEDAVKEMQKVIEINPDSNYVWSVDAEKGIGDLDHLIIIFNHIIEKYEKGTITISRACEILNRDTFDLLDYMNNEKVAKSLNISDEIIDKFRNSSINKRDVLIEETLLGILAKAGILDLLRKAFDHVYITKDLENKIFTGAYLKDNPYREVKNRLQVINGGWIESLIPRDTTINIVEKIVSKSEFSKNDVSFISLALDKDLICLTEDLLLRVQLENVNKSTCGIVGFINYAVSKEIIKEDDSEKMLDKVKKFCII